MPFVRLLICLPAIASELGLLEAPLIVQTINNLFMNRNLIKLFSTGDIGTVQTLVQAEPLVSIRVLSSNGETPLHFAARHGEPRPPSCLFDSS